MKEMKLKKSIKVTIIAIVIIAAVAAIITVVVVRSGSKENINTELTPTISANSQTYSPEENSKKEDISEAKQGEYDISAIKSEDIVTSSVMKAEVDEDRNMSLILKDGSTVDVGNIGGENVNDTVTVTFVDYDNSIIKVEMVKKGTAATPPKNPVNSEYNFIGWIGNYTSPQEDSVITAAYVEKSKYATVTFCDYDGSVLMVETVPIGKSAKGPVQEPVRDGYRFTGWDSGIESVSENIKVTAKYVDLDNPVFEIEQVNAKPGDKNVPVVVAIKNNPGICSLKLDFKFADGLTLTEISFNQQKMGGTFLGPQSYPCIEKSSALWYKYDTDIDEDGTLMTLYFDVADNAEGKLFIKLSYDSDDVFNIENENITFGVINGSIETIES